MAALPCCERLQEKWQSKLEDPVSQKRIILVIVCLALLLDNMLYMVIVPIIPVYLERMDDWKERKVVTEWVNTTELYTIPPDMLTPTPDDIPDQVATPPTEPVSAAPHEPFYRTVLRNISHIEFLINKPAQDRAVGYLFASKAILQLFIGPISGTVIDKIGYDKPMFFGLAVIFLSTTIFSFGKSYAALFVARSMQGMGSAFADTAGLAMIADRYQEPAERSTALGIALAFISFGCLVAPPFGGVLYQFAGKELPFIILATIALIDGFLLLAVMKPIRQARNERQVSDQMPSGTPIWRLFIDPYIAICAGALAMSNVSLAFLEPTIAVWMEQTMNATNWQMGLVWLPAFPPHVFGVYLTVYLAARFPKYQWLMAAIGLALEGVSCIVIPFIKSFGLLIIPLSTICFGIALVDTALLPTLGYIVDTRHTSVYGSVYAIADISYCFAYAFGPVLAGQIVATYGFTLLNMAIFISNVVYAPLLFFLWRIYKYKPLDLDDAKKAAGGEMASEEQKALRGNEDGEVQRGAPNGTGVYQAVEHQYYAGGAPEQRWEGVDGLQGEAGAALSGRAAAEQSSDDDYGY